MTAWQPIETAPKDGSDVLLFYAEVYGQTHQVIIGHWNPRGFWVWQHRAVRGYSYEPTHWMPLPPAPVSP